MLSLLTQHICVCLLAISLCENPSGSFLEFLRLFRFRFISLHTTTGYVWWVLHIRVFDDNSAPSIAPELRAFLDSRVVFAPRITAAFSSCFDLPELIATSCHLRSRSVDLPTLSGQSSVMFATQLSKLSDRRSFLFQFTVEADGRKVLRVLSCTFRLTSAVDRIDGVTLGCFLARRLAAGRHFSSSADAYRRHRETCVELVSGSAVDLPDVPRRARHAVGR